MTCHCGNNNIGEFINMQTCMCCRIKQKELQHYKLSYPNLRSLQRNDILHSGHHDSQTFTKEFVYCYKCASFVYKFITGHIIQNSVVPLIDRNYDTLNIYPCDIPRKNGSFSCGKILSNKNNPPILVNGGIYVYVEFESGNKLMKKYTRLIDILICNPGFAAYLKHEYFRMNLQYEYVQNYYQSYTNTIKTEANAIYNIIYMSTPSNSST